MIPSTSRANPAHLTILTCSLAPSTIFRGKVAHASKYAHIAADLVEVGAEVGSRTKRLAAEAVAQGIAAAKAAAARAAATKKRKDEAAGPNSGRALYDAVNRNDIARAKELVKMRAALTFAENRTGFTILHIAALRGNVGVVKKMLKKGVKADVKAKNGMVPLHMACHGGHTLICMLLLKTGPLTMRAARETVGGRCPHDMALERGLLELALAVEQCGTAVASATAEQQPTEQPTEQPMVLENVYEDAAGMGGAKVGADGQDAAGERPVSRGPFRSTPWDGGASALSVETGADVGAGAAAESKVPLRICPPPLEAQALTKVVSPHDDESHAALVTAALPTLPPIQDASRPGSRGGTPVKARTKPPTTKTEPLALPPL